MILDLELQKIKKSPGQKNQIYQFDEKFFDQNPFLQFTIFTIDSKSAELKINFFRCHLQQL